VKALTAEIDAAEGTKTELLGPDLERSQAGLKVAEARPWAFLIDSATAKPCYFNAGSCTGEDGEITGIEIADGEIRAVRWYQTPHDPEVRISSRTPLAEVFDLCR